MKILRHQNLRKRVMVYCRPFNVNKYLGLLLLILLLLSGGLRAQTQINNKYCVNSIILAMAKSPDGGMYIGGAFKSVAEYCGSAVKLNNSSTPGFNINDVEVEGFVNAVVPIPGGGWYVGGSFASVSGMPRKNLCRINSDGTLNEFTSSVNIQSLYSLAIDNSGKLYVGGNFPSGNGIISFNPDGTSSTFNASFNGVVTVLAIDSNGNLFAGGNFTSPRNRLAKFNADGSLNTFSPVFNTGEVTVIKFNSLGDILVGGSFTSVNGSARSRFAKFNSDTTLNSLSLVFNNIIKTIAIDGSDNFYVGGQFTTVNSGARAYVAKFTSTGALSTFNPFVSTSNFGVNALQIDSSGNLYCGGSFTLAAGATRNFFAKFNTDGSLNTYNPSMNGLVNTIAINQSGTVFVGGTFTGINAVTRNRFAAFNADGTLKTFAPNITSIGLGVTSIAVDGLGNLYLGGDFTNVNGVTRNGIAKFNPNLTLNAFGAGTGFNNIGVAALATDAANNLYVGGNFDNYAGVPRNGFAKFDASGVLGNFNPLGSFSSLEDIKIDGQDNIYLGGNFTQVLGQSRNNFAKLNPDGTLSDISPVFDSSVNILTLDNSGNIYAGGYFTTVNGVSRTNLAKINADGSLNSLNHIIDGLVESIIPTPSGNLYIGGQFTSVDGIERICFAKFNSNGTVSNFTQRGNYWNSAMLMDGSKLHTTGGFQKYNVYDNADSSCDLTLSNPIPASRCGAGTVQLSITPSSGSVNWYDAPANGNLVGTGTTFTTPTISTTTTYYAEAVDGACFSFTRTAVTATITTGCESVINLKLFVQGYYSGNNAMTPVAFNQGSSTDTNEVELLTVELWDPVTQTLATSTQALLKTDGTAICNYATAPNGSYYLAVKGSNFIKTWSANPVTVGPTPLTYDFTDSADKAYLANMAPLGNNVFGFHSGDINQDNSVDTADYSLWEFDGNNYAFGVYPTDLNGDGIVDFADYSFWEYNNNNYIMGYGPW